MEGSVQLDHDYCNNGNSPHSKSNKESTSKINKKSTVENKFTKKIVKEELPKRVQYDKLSNNAWVDNTSRKDSGLESGDVSDASEDRTSVNSPGTTKLKGLSSENIKRKEFPLNKINFKQKIESKPAIKASPTVSLSKPTPEMKIQSVLATSILQLRKGGVLTKTKPIEGTQKMVSVLKKPPKATQPPLLCINSNESIVTTTNSSNNEVQNIIIQNTQFDSQEDLKKPPRKKLNLAEYRSRREQNRSDSSRTSSPIQPMTLVYIHHVSTTTTPVQGDLESLVWSEREIVSVLKPKSDFEDEKVRPKPKLREAAAQTNETVFSQLLRTKECNSSSLIKNPVQVLNKPLTIENKRPIEKKSLVKRAVENKRPVASNRSLESKQLPENKQLAESKLVESKQIESKPVENKRPVEKKILVAIKHPIETKRSIESKNSTPVNRSPVINEKNEVSIIASSSSPKVRENEFTR